MSTDRVLVNLGCGPDVKRTAWIDCDGSWNVLASRLPLGLGWLARKSIGQVSKSFPPHVRYVNVTKKLPFADGTVDAIYFSHLLEHLHLNQGQHLLRDSWRILKAGGVLRVLVPDTEHYIDRYLAARAAGNNAGCLEFNESLMFRSLTAESGFLRKIYTAATDFHSHKFMYDRAFLSDSLAQAGFAGIEEVTLNKSRILEVADVESAERIGHGRGFGFEAIKQV